MNKIIFLLLLFCAKNSTAQFVNQQNIQPANRDSLVNEAGENLQKFSRKIGASVGLYAIAGLTFYAATKVDGQKETINTAAAVVAITGLIFNIMAPNHVAKAGRIFQLLSGQPTSLNLQKKSKFRNNLIMDFPQK